MPYRFISRIYSLFHIKQKLHIFFSKAAVSPYNMFYDSSK